MAEPYQFKNPAIYSPGQIAFNNNAEMSRLISLLGGDMLQNMVGYGNFLPHMMASQNVMDQYIARQYQNQVRASTFYMAGAGNQDVAKRLLAMRTAITDAPASELNRQQAEQFAGMINHPIAKSVLGTLFGPENLEAALHGTKGDVAALNQVVNRVGFFRRDPSGGKRMDARSLEDFSRGLYAHLYEEGGNLSGAEAGARLATDTTTKFNANPDVQRLKKYARMEEQTVVSDAEIADRVTKRITDEQLSADDVAATYKKYIAGDEKDTNAQVVALTKFDEAIKSLDSIVKSKSTDGTGILQKNEVTLDNTVQRAQKNRVGEMHGFMAGQVGQIAEQMFQRGMLPQAIGAMTPAERVKLLQEDAANRDPETIRRLAEEFGHRDLMARDVAYAEAPDAKKREMLENKRSEYTGKINAVLDAAGAGVSAQEIEKMEGVDAVAGNVDAKRSASAIKKYSGAVAAVREIFGENGNPNAPMPALLAALDHLSQGAASQMDPRKLESSLRAMQEVAREAGIGFEQMAGMAAQMGATGDMLGVSRPQTIANQVKAMAVVKTMRDAGAFSNFKFGAMSQPEAEQFVAKQIQAGAASDDTKTLAAALSIYKSAPGAFKEDSEFAAAMKAYDNPSSGGDYTFTDANGKRVTKNIYDIVGKGGPQAVLRMFRAEGGRDEQLSAAFMNPETMQYARRGELLMQRAEMLRDVNNLGVSGKLLAQLRTAKQNAPDTDLAKQNENVVANFTGQAIAELIIESGDKEPEEQIDFIKKEMVPTLKEAFLKNGVTDEKEAERLAQQAATAYIGADETKQGQEIKLLTDRVAGVLKNVGNMTTTQANQLYRRATLTESDEYGTRAESIAQRKAEVGLNFGVNALASMSDYLLRVGKNNGKIETTELLKAATQMIPEEELRQKYVAGMQGGLSFVQDELNKLTVSEGDIDTLAKTARDENAAAADKTAAEKEIKRLAKLDDNIKIVSDADFKQRLDAKMAETLKDDETVKKQYAEVFGKEKTAESVEKQRAELMQSEAFQQTQSSGLLADNERTLAQATMQAKKSAGFELKTIAGETPEQRQERELRRERLQTVRRGFFAAANKTDLQAGVNAALSLFNVDTKHSKELMELMSHYDSSDKDKDKEHATALEKKIMSFGLSDEATTALLRTSEATRTGVKIDHDGVLGQMDRAAAMANGAAQQVAQHITNASIEARAVTINAGKVEGAQQAGGDAASKDPAAAPAKDAVPPPTPAAEKTGAGATGASGAATNASAEAKTAATTTASLPAAPAGGGQKEVTLTGNLEITNLEAGVLTVLAKHLDAPPTETPGGGSPVTKTTRSA